MKELEVSVMLFMGNGFSQQIIQPPWTYNIYYTLGRYMFFFFILMLWFSLSIEPWTKRIHFDFCQFFKLHGTFDLSNWNDIPALVHRVDETLDSHLVSLKPFLVPLGRGWGRHRHGLRVTYGLTIKFLKEPRRPKIHPSNYETERQVILNPYTGWQA